MSRSPPLRVYRLQLSRAFHTRFRFASISEKLRLATDNNSQTHYAKGTPSLDRSQAPTLCMQLVSGTISLP